MLSALPSKQAILPPMDPRATADLLKSWALEAGFDRAGVARLEPLEHGEASGALARPGGSGGDGVPRAADGGAARSLPDLPRRPERALRGASVPPLDRRRGAAAGALRGPLAPGGPLRPREGLPRRHGRAAPRLEARVRAAFPGVRDAALRGHRAGPRARAGGAGRDRRRWGRTPCCSTAEGGSWFLLGELFLEPRLDARPAARGPLRELHPLPRRLPDRRARRALPARQQPLHLLLDDRAPRARCPPRRRDGGRVGLRLRRLPGGLPLERRADGGRHPRDGAAGRSAASSTSARLLGLPREEYVERFRGSPMKRAEARGVAAQRRRRDGEPPGVPLCRTARGSLARRGVLGCAATRPGRWDGSGEEARAALEAALAAEGDEAVRSGDPDGPGASLGLH